MKDFIFEKFSDFADRLIKNIKNKVDQLEVLVGINTGIKVSFKNGELVDIEETNSFPKIGLRVINNGRLGITGSLKLIDEEQLLKEARLSSLYGNKAFFNFPSDIGVLPQIKTFDIEVPKISVKKVVFEAKQALDFLRSTLPDFTPELLIAYWGWGKSRLINSFGLDLSRTGTKTHVLLFSSRRRKDDFFHLFSEKNNRKWEGRILDLACDVKEKADLGRKISKIDKGDFWVVFPPETVYILLDYLSYAVNGRMVNDHTSKLAAKLGKKIFDKRITLVDSSLEDFRPSSYLFDDEGVPAQRQTLINKGIVSNFLYDLQEAGKAKVESTGSGFRGSVFSRVMPTTSNFLLSPGKKSWASLLRKIKNGILVYSFIGEGQGNISNGDFSLGVQLGYLIKNGELIGRVKDIGITGNVFDLLRGGLVDLSKEVEWHGSVKAPYVILNGVKISSRS